MIHDARQDAGESGRKRVTLPVLTPANIPRQLRRMATWGVPRQPSSAGQPITTLKALDGEAHL